MGVVSCPSIGQLNDWEQKLDSVRLVLPKEGWWGVQGVGSGKRVGQIRDAWESQGSDSSTTHAPIQGSAEGLIRVGTREGADQCRNQKETRKGVR